MKKNEKDIQYKIIKSEVCGHSIEYRMVKKEIELEKAKIDEGLSAKEKKKARKERSEGFVPHEKEKFHSEGYREYKAPQSQEKLKQKLKSKERPKLPSKEDLEYPMAASEEMEKCIDNPDCDCQEKKKKMKKSSNFYIQKIQELRKAVSSIAENTPKIPNSQLQRGIQNSIQANTPGASSGGNALADSMGMPSAQEMSKPLTQNSQPNQPEYKMDAPSFTGSDPSKSPYINLKNAGNTVDVHNFDPNKFKAQVTGQKDNQAQNIQDYTKANNAYNAEVKAGSNKFISDLASNKSVAPTASPATPNIPMASPSPNTPGLSADATKQAQTAANPAAANPTAANPTAQKPQSFGEAFKAARDARLGGTGSDTFDWNGKKYHSFSKDDFAQGQGGKYNPAAKAGAAAPAAAPAAKPTMFSNSANASVLDTEPGKEMISDVSNKLSGQPAAPKTIPAKQASANFDNEYYNAQNEAPTKQINPSIQQGMAGSPSIPSSSKGMDLNRTNLRPPETNLKTPKGPA